MAEIIKEIKGKLKKKDCKPNVKDNKIVDELKKNISCLIKDKGKSKGDTKYIKGDTKYIEGPTKYIEGDTKYIEGPTKYIEGPTKYVPGKTKYVPGETKYVPGETKYVPGETKYVQSNVMGQSDVGRKSNVRGQSDVGRKSNVSMDQTIKGAKAYNKETNEYIKEAKAYNKATNEYNKTYDNEYIKEDIEYIEKTSNYEYLKYILLIFILLIGGYVIISVIKDMNKITDKINKQKLTPETISNISVNIVQNKPNTNIYPKIVKEEEDKKSIKKAPIKKEPVKKPEPVKKESVKKVSVKKEPVKKVVVEESDKLKKTIDQQKYIKKSPFEFCWYKENSNDNSCYFF